jgi:DNA-directed RNA polymerase specialized sigma24 family protein
MTSPSSDPWPDDADRLARIAADAGRTNEERGRAFDALRPTIWRVGQRLAVRFSGQPRVDLEADAESDVWEALPKLPPTVRFEPWCYAVLRNRRTDWIRHEGVERQHADEAARQRREAEDLRGALERAAARHDSLPAADVEAIGGWPARDRVVLLCVSGLWAKTPPQQWERWVDEYRQHYDAPDDGPFPPAELQESDEVARRNELLAQALGERPNTLAVCLYRGKKRLLALQYVRDLLPPSGQRGSQP